MGERIDFLVSPFAPRRLPKLYQCEVCAKRLNRRQVVAVSSAARIRDPELGTGGGSVTAEFCQKHAPQEGTP